MQWLPMSEKKHEQLHDLVRGHYGKIAVEAAAGCGCGPAGCCETPGTGSIIELSGVLGYSREDVLTVPKGANLGLGCGNPHLTGSIRDGETVLDLGSGGGHDCFLAAGAVGENGRVIGVDMTPEMIARARQNAEKTDFRNIEFRLGEIENLPAADGFVDVILSNCVINLSPDKERVFQEAFRVLKPGGRLAISDVVRTADFPEEMLRKTELYSQCVTGAASIEELEIILEKVGFENVNIRPIDGSRTFIREWNPDNRVEDYIVSASIEAHKPPG